MPRRKLKKGDKAQMVRSMPGAPADRVVAEAGRRGIPLTAAYVSAVRSLDRRSSTRSTSSGEEALRRGFAQVGLGRSRLLLAEAEALILGH